MDLKEPEVAEDPAPAVLSAEEIDVLDHLRDAWRCWCKLKEETGRTREFLDAIHRCQDLIALRVARRANPEIWR